MESYLKVVASDFDVTVLDTVTWTVLTRYSSRPKAIWMIKFKAVFGKQWNLDFESEGDEPVQIINSLKEFKDFEVKAKEFAIRRSLTWITAFGFMVALLLATVWGWQQADFSGVQKVWSAGSVPLGWIAGYYFGKDGNKS